MTKGELRAKLARSNKKQAPKGGQRRQKRCRKARRARACAPLQPAASGVEPKAGPAGRIGDLRCMKDRKIDAGEAGGSEPPRRLSGRRCGALREAVPDEVRAGSAGAPAQVLGEVHRHVTGSAIASAGGTDGSRAQHAAGDAERSEAASAARSARENDGAAATPLARKETDRATRVTRPAMRSSQAARMTGMPSCLALSTRFSVMPLPGKAMTPFGRRFRSSSLRRNGAARPWRSQSGLQTIW